MRVKICGIRRLSDALLAARLGADAIGVLVGQEHPSADFVTPEAAGAILAALPPFVSGVLVSHWRDPDDLLALIRRLQPQVVQLHSPIPPAAVQRLRQALPGLRLLKAVSMPPEPPRQLRLESEGAAAVSAVAQPEGGTDPLAALAPYVDLVDGFVADSCNPATGQVGGTGLRHDWGVTAALARRLPRPLLLAGGLDAATVGEAIRRVRPHGVDVNSGVKGVDGFKEARRLERFIQAVRAEACPPPAPADPG